MVCFVSSADGQSHCARSGVSGVASDLENGGLSGRIEIRGNIVSSPDRTSVTAHVLLTESTGLEMGLHDAAGRLVRDLSGEIPESRPIEGEFNVEIPVGDLVSGEYFVRLLTSDGVIGTRLIVE